MFVAAVLCAIVNVNIDSVDADVFLGVAADAPLLLLLQMFMLWYLICISKHTQIETNRTYIYIYIVCSEKFIFTKFLSYPLLLNTF